jgi:hypothetical protein
MIQVLPQTEVRENS